MAKKVWILERYINSAEMVKSLEELKGFVEAAEKVKDKVNDIEIAALKDAVVRYQEKMQQYPDGYWLGHVGRSNYKQFCWDAKESMRFWLRNQGKKADELRVVEGYIKDNSKTWIGYTVAKVNDGVKRYLLATM